MRIPINGTKAELVQRCRDLEARGWKVVQGITAKRPEQFGSSHVSHKFEHTRSNYYAIYEKEEK